MIKQLLQTTALMMLIASPALAQTGINGAVGANTTSTIGINGDTRTGSGLAASQVRNNAAAQAQSEANDNVLSGRSDLNGTTGATTDNGINAGVGGSARNGNMVGINGSTSTNNLGGADLTGRGGVRTGVTETNATRSTETGATRATETGGNAGVGTIAGTSADASGMGSMGGSTSGSSGSASGGHGGGGH